MGLSVTDMVRQEGGIAAFLARPSGKSLNDKSVTSNSALGNSDSIKRDSHALVSSCSSDSGHKNTPDNFVPSESGSSESKASDNFSETQGNTASAHSPQSEKSKNKSISSFFMQCDSKPSNGDSSQSQFVKSLMDATKNQNDKVEPSTSVTNHNCGNVNKGVLDHSIDPDVFSQLPPDIQEEIMSSNAGTLSLLSSVA